MRKWLERSSDPHRGWHVKAPMAVERDFQRELGRTEDFREGVTAFLAKRKAEFKGQ